MFATWLFFHWQRTKMLHGFLWPKCMLSISYWEADQTCCNTQGQLWFNDPMRVSPNPAHDLQRSEFEFEFVEKNIYLCINFCLALHVSNPLRELLLISK